jgi:hypothetical protein
MKATRVTSRPALSSLLAIAALSLVLGLSSCGKSSQLTAPETESLRTGAQANAGKPALPAVPTLAAPANGAAAQPTALSLSWNAVTGANNYNLQVSTNANFSALLVNVKGVGATSYALSGLANSRTYYWRVAAKGPGGTSAFSGAFSFATASAAVVVAPAAPTLVSPLNHAAGVATSATLAWNAVTGASSYRVQVSASPAFDVLAIDSPGLTGTSLFVTGLNANTLYYWRVCAANLAGEGAFSAVCDFTTASALALAPALLSPANLAIDQPLALTLSWAASANATSYNLQVATSSTFATPLVQAAGVTATSFPLSGLSAGTVYYWRVSASNASGTSDWSAAQQFTTAAVLNPCGSLAGMSGTVNNVTAEFVSNRAGRLRFEADGDLASGVIQATADCAASATPSIQYIGGSANVTVAATGQSVLGGPLTFGPLLWGGLSEPAVVVINDAFGNVLEIIWPSLDPTLPPGPPILRLQLESHDPTLAAPGAVLNVDFQYQAQAADGSIATFRVIANGLVVPVAR